MVNPLQQPNRVSLAVLLLGLIAVTAWCLWPLKAIETTEAPDWSGVSAESRSPSREPIEIASFEPIWKEILSEPTAVAPPPPPPPVTDLKPRSDITLVATIVERGQSRAIVRISGSLRRVLVGDRIDEALVTSIGDRQIELETDGRRKIIELPEPRGQTLIGARP